MEILRYNRLRKKNEHKHQEQIDYTGANFQKTNLPEIIQEYILWS